MHPLALRDMLIRVVEVAKNGHRAYRPSAAPAVRRQGLGQCLPETLVRPRPVEVGGALAERAPQVALAEDQQVVQALAAHAAKEALAHGVRPRGAIGPAQDRDPARDVEARERRPEPAVVVADEIPRALVERRCFTELLGDPGVGWMPLRAQVDDPPGRQLDDEEAEERPEEDVQHRQEVAGPDRWVWACTKVAHVCPRGRGEAAPRR